MIKIRALAAVTRDNLSAPAQYITIVVYRAPPPSARRRVLRVRLSREAAATESLIDS